MIIEEINACVIMPTYNNENTLRRVLLELISMIPSERIIVVNDGSTDQTSVILAEFSDQITLVELPENKGKGFALRTGFKTAISKGFDSAITIDSDGQHYPKDIEVLLKIAKENPNAVLMGSRNMEQDGVPQKSSFGNKFSNFWFKVETWITLPDTQTGFRLYPLDPLKKMKLRTTKFELEIEVIVRLAWKGLKFIPVNIDVKYDANERVSHFRPGRDFFRISVLNSVLFFGALFYYYPKKFLSVNTLRLIKDEAIKPEESNLMKSLSLAFGVFMGIVPIWGFQLIVGIPLAIFFRMNKVLFIAAANISIPPMIPLILLGSLATGQFFLGGEIELNSMLNFSSEAILKNAYQYVFGAIILAVLSFVAVFLISFILFKIFRKEPVIES